MNNTRPIFGLLVSAMLAVPLTLCAQNASSNKTLAVVTIGVDDTHMVNDITNYLSLNVSAPIRYAGHQSDPGKEFEAAVQQIASKKVDADFAILAVFNIPQDIAFQQAVVQTKRVGLVNIYSLTTALDLQKDTDRDTYLRRVHKQIMYVAGQLVGLQPCIFPHCAMVPTATLEQLDAKGANFCPPCWGKAEKLLREQGIQPLTDR